MGHFHPFSIAMLNNQRVWLRRCIRSPNFGGMYGWSTTSCQFRNDQPWICRLWAIVRNHPVFGSWLQTPITIFTMKLLWNTAMALEYCYGIQLWHTAMVAHPVQACTSSTKKKTWNSGQVCIKVHWPEIAELVLFMASSNDAYRKSPCWIGKSTNWMAMLAM